ncbi:MAG: tetratricopeptide repeat protein [Cyanothece sp. SIO1E1]|nr:tetratricopeptide repeat protein [Cyanothece sp. SIO1E1]
MPRSGVTIFVGRAQELEDIRGQLQQGSSVSPVLAIRGMGGVGKTELALQYALESRHQYLGGICWLSGRGTNIGTQIVQFARSRFQLNPSEKLELLDQVGFCWTHWPLGNVLIIIDDVVDYKSVKPYLPPTGPRFNILITTRFRLGKSVQQIGLNVLDADDSLYLLEGLIGEDRVQEDLETASQLCDWLGHLPLAIELVGRYLDNKPDLSLVEMQKRLEKKRLAQPSLRKADEDMTLPMGVASAFDLSWDTLDSNSKQLGCVLGLFASAPIPWALVEQVTVDDDPDDLEEIRDYQLIGFHLLQREGDGSYQLHQLIREFFRQKWMDMDIGEDQKRLFCKVMIKVAQAIPESPTRKLLIEMAVNIPHIAETAINLNNYLNEEDFIAPFKGLIRFYEGQGFYEQAEFWAEQCCSIAEERFSSDHLNIATCLNQLASIYRIQGRYSEAKSLYEEALNKRYKLWGSEHIDIADSLNNLALLYYDQGQYTEAESLYAESLALRTSILGDDHPEVADSLNNLGVLYNTQGRYAEAEPRLIKALDMRRRLLNHTNPRIITSLNNLAYCYDLQNKHKDAEKSYIEALELSKQLLGEEHPEIVNILNNVAHLYMSQECFEAAKPLFEKSLNLGRKLLGEKHPVIAANMSNLAGCYESLGQYLEAEPLYLQSIGIRRQVLDEKHPHLAISLNNLAKLYYLQNRYSEARPLYIEALDILESKLGIEHPITVKVHDNLEQLQSSQQ